MKSFTPEKPEDIKELVDNAFDMQFWKNHLEKDLMKFWDRSEAYELDGGLFPTYRTNTGEKLPADKRQWPEEFTAASKDPNTSELIKTDYNFVRAHSRQTYAYGIAFHMTGEKHYLELCRKGALALVDAIDGNYGMFVTRNKSTGHWDSQRSLRTSQDLAYGLTGLGMYYFLTHDAGIMHRIIQIKDYIFDNYMDDDKGYLTWLPKREENSEIQIVAQLDQLYAYMLMITPSLPEPYRSIWKKDMKKIADILITQFYSEKYKFFWGTADTSKHMALGTDHTDFGHSVKTFWVILKIGEMLGDPFYIDFARPKIDKILNDAYIEETGSWARRMNADGSLDTDKEWWILAELDQAAEILSIHDPSYYHYLNNTHKYWRDVMTDHEHGEIWHMVSGKDNKPVINFPKVHNWKTSLHSFEHALFSYMTAARVKGEICSLYYALPEWEEASQHTVSPYMFFGKVQDYDSGEILENMPDKNKIYEVRFNGIH